MEPHCDPPDDTDENASKRKQVNITDDATIESTEIDDADVYEASSATSSRTVRCDNSSNKKTRTNCAPTSDGKELWTTAGHIATHVRSAAVEVDDGEDTGCPQVSEMLVADIRLLHEYNRLDYLSGIS